MTQPEMTDLFTLTDNSNPLNIREGNPNLKPSFTNNINVDYNRYFELTRQSLNGNMSFSTTSNSITNRTEYNEETGGQTSRPENINGRWNMSGNIGFTTPLFCEQLLLNSNTSGYYSNSPAYVYQNKETFKNNVKQTSLGENMSITLRFNNFDVRATGRINWNKSESDYALANNQNTFNFSYGLSSTGNFDNGFGFSTDINMNSRRGYASANMNTNELIWNAQISYRFLYKKTATIMLRANDILNKRSNISRTISAYSRQDRETNSIYSYVMATFQYRFNLFGTQASRQNLREMRGMQYDRPDFGGEGGGRGLGGEGGRGGGERF